MTLQEALNQTQACGTDQNRKIWSRHGLQGDMFGAAPPSGGRALLQRIYG